MAQSNLRKNKGIFEGSEIVIFDGSNSTELYERGFYINRPFEELNLSAPGDVVAVHKSFIEAGSNVICSNTFACALPQLRNFDIENKQETLIKKGLELGNVARKSKPGVSLLFSIGPLGELVEPLGPTGLSEVREEFARIAKFAKDSGFEFEGYSLESFSNPHELVSAAEGIRSVDPHGFILGSFLVESSQHSRFKIFQEIAAPHPAFNAFGLDGAEGPSDLLKQLNILKTLTTKPIVVRPTAGIPRHVNNRYFYMTSPDYLGKFAKRYVDAGARGVGGSSGISPKHIEAVKLSLQMIMAQGAGESTPPQAIKVLNSTELLKRPSLEERTQASTLADCLIRKEKIISIELSPPKGTHLEPFLKNLDLLKSRSIKFVNIPDGARASTKCSSLHLAVWAANNKNLGIRVIPHFTTRDRNLIALQSDLIGASINGVNEVLIVTGDPPRLGNNKDATAVYDIDSIGLTHLVDCLNRGGSPKGDSIGSKTQFTIGVASNPTAVNLNLELERWKYKVDMGADFSITQPIYDPDCYFAWLDKIGPNPRPFIVGIWPLISMRNAEFMANEVPGVHIPKWVLEEMAKAEGVPEEAQKRGRDIALKVMSQIGKQVAGFAISAPLGKVEAALNLLDKRGQPFA